MKEVSSLLIFTVIEWIDTPIESAEEWRKQIVNTETGNF
jgi:hypothetical protein